MKVVAQQARAVEVRLVEGEAEGGEDRLGPLQVPPPQQHVDVALEAAGEPRPLGPQAGPLEEDERDPRPVEPGQPLAQLLVAAQVVHRHREDLPPQVGEPPRRPGVQPLLAGAQGFEDVGLDLEAVGETGEGRDLSRPSHRSRRAPPGRDRSGAATRVGWQVSAPRQGWGRPKFVVRKTAICPRFSTASGQ